MPIPKVAIGLPVFNGEQHVRKALNSLLNQTYREFVVLISDNCSDDNTVEICKQTIGVDPRFKIVEQRFNIGAVPNFNYVARNTTSNYFKWMAADDTFHPTYLERCIEVMDCDQEVAWCHCRSDMIDDDGKSWLNRISVYDPLVEISADGKWWKGHPRQHYDSNVRVDRFGGVLLGTTWSVDSYGLIRRSALNRTRLLEPIYGAEKVLMAELSLYGKYYHIPDMLFSQRIHSQASGNLSDKKSRQVFIANQKKIGSARLSLLKAHVYSVLRSDLSFLQKLKALYVVSCYVMQFGKWIRVLRQMMGGDSVRGGGREMMERAEEYAEVQEQ